MPTTPPPPDRPPPDDRDAPFVPISPNPYIVGNPIRDRQMFFGREAEFALIEQRFRYTRAEGGLIVLCGERRSGKTSILFQIMNGRLGPDFVPVLIDMQAMAITDEADFLAKIAGEIVAAMAANSEVKNVASDVLPDFQAEFRKGARPADVFRRFVLSLLKADPVRKIVLLFDEYELFESKIESGTLTEEALHILSNLMETQRVFLVYTGSLNLEERRKEYWRVFLGRSTYRPISFLDRQDAVRLITQPVGERVDFSPGVVDHIYRLTAGQPFYTQAVCQNLIDTLNEQKTRHATMERVDAVVANIVSNAFPQMIFMWQGLPAEEKLALALLGQALDGPDSHATVRDLIAAIRKERYPVQLDAGQLAPALEALFRREMLLKDQAAVPGYAFKMDLWRHWIRRMHSVWQVVRELGIPFRARRPRWQLQLAAGLPVALAAVMGIGMMARGHGCSGQPFPPPPAPVLTDSLDISILVRPESAEVYVDERLAATGAWAGRLSPGHHQVLLKADGYRDSTLAFDLAASGMRNIVVQLRPRTGSVRVVTEPPGAEVAIDNIPRGVTPRVVGNLAVPDEHRLDVSLANHGTASRTFRVMADRVTELPPFKLSPAVSGLAIMTTPERAELIVDGHPQGMSNRTVAVPAGPHRVQIHLAGYIDVDTTVSVAEQPVSLAIQLRPVPPGYLIVMGRSLAGEIQIDGKTLFDDPTFNSERRELPAGDHRIRVVLTSNDTVTTNIKVNPREEVTFNYTDRTQTRRRITP